MSKSTVIAGLTWLAIAALAVVSGLFVAGGAPQEAPAGIPEPDALVAWGAPAVRLVTTVSAFLTVGLLVMARLRSTGATAAAFVALVWVGLALAQVFFVLANVLALPLADATSLAVATTYAGEIATTRALLAAAILAFIVSFAVITSGRASATWIVLAVIAAALPSLANHASGLGDHALALTGNAAHAAAASLYVGALLVLVWLWLRRVPIDAHVLARYSSLALACWLVLAASGVVNGYVRLESPQQLVTTGYGLLLIVKAALLVVIGLVGWRIKMRFAQRRKVLPLALIDATLVACAVGLGIALASSPYPRLQVPFGSLPEALLGAPLPPSPTPWTVVLGFRLDPVFAVAVLLGVIILVKQWTRWPNVQRVPWIAGLIGLAWVTNSGPHVYAPVSPGWAALQAALLMGPVALVLARGWHAPLPGNRWTATGLLIAAQIVIAALGGWSSGSYASRTAALVLALLAGVFFFGHVRNRRSAAAPAALVMLTGLATTAWSASQVAPWFVLIQPAWLSSLVADAQFGAWLGYAIFAMTVVAAVLWSGLAISVDPASPARHTERSSSG